MEKELTRKQAAFAELITHNLSATEAAKQSGYSEKTAYAIASENLKKPEINAVVQQNLSQRMARLGINGDSIVMELWKIAINEDLQTGPRVNALATCAKLLGLLVDKAEVSVNGPKTIEDLVEKMNADKRFARVDGKVIEINKEVKE